MTTYIENILRLDRAQRERLDFIDPPVTSYDQLVTACDDLLDEMDRDRYRYCGGRGRL